MTRLLDVDLVDLVVEKYKALNTKSLEAMTIPISEQSTIIAYIEESKDKSLIDLNLSLKCYNISFILVEENTEIELTKGNYYR